MKKIIFAVFLVFISALSIAQVAGRCAHCPPSPNSQNGKVLSSNGTSFQWATPSSSQIFDGNGIAINNDSVNLGGYLNKTTFIGEAKHPLAFEIDSIIKFYNDYNAVETIFSGSEYWWNVVYYDTATQRLLFNGLDASNMTNQIYDVSSGINTSMTAFMTDTNDIGIGISIAKQFDLGFAVGVYKQPNYSAELNIYDPIGDRDIARLQLTDEGNRIYGQCILHLDDSSGTGHNIRYENNEIRPETSVWSLGTPAYKFKDGAITEMTFVGMDSVTMVAQTPLNGTTTFCTNCSGTGVTGRFYDYYGGTWRRRPVSLVIY